MNELYDLADLEMLARDCLTRAGIATAEARIVARDVALSEAVGRSECGFEALLRDIRLIRYGRLHADAVPQITEPAGVVLHIDAGHGFAAPAIARALPRLIEMARTEGMALIHLTRASDPGAMAGAMTDLATSGLAGLSLRSHGQAFAVRPSSQRITPFESRPDSVLTSLLALAPPSQDSPLDGPVNVTGWLGALDPDVTGVEDILRSLPTDDLPPMRRGISVAPELLAQIVNA
ncbi:hypothetical protein HKCCE4037_07385 [Rhodobacterales bacterium HKCCE4037]|nr:hypothetical protein [Rhodobacterales bacterium HKCCE4037]